MKLWWKGIRAWYQRRFRGFVAAPAQHGGRGTSWQEHKRHEIGFTCRCGQVLAFKASDLVVRDRDHVEGCDGWDDGACDCRITDARHVKICPSCGLGHWNDATPQSSIARRHA
jgi:hypothetical protein